jgi:hypothetical protein
MFETVLLAVPSIVHYCIMIFLTLFVSYCIYEYVCSKLRPDIFPEAYPFETSLELFFSTGHNETFLKKAVYMYEKLGKETCCFNMFGLPWLVVTNDVQNVTHTLKNVKTYGKGPKWYSRMKHLLGNGIFSADGDQWYKHRKTSSHLFNLNKFRNEMIDTFNQHCTMLIKAIGTKSKAAKSVEKGEEGGPFDIQDLFLKFTLDSIGKIAFGKSIGALQKDRVLFAESFDFCQFQANATFIDPLWLFKRYLTPAGWLYHYHIRRLNKFAYDLVLER